MFQFSGFRVSFLILFRKEQYCIISIRLPHSEISGSELVCSSPKLIAAYHVLHRLLAPRHPLCALYNLIPFSNPFCRQACESFINYGIESIFVYLLTPIKRFNDLTFISKALLCLCPSVLTNPLNIRRRLFLSLSISNCFKRSHTHTSLRIMNY